MRVFGYVRVSTDVQAIMGVGLETQQRAIEVNCEARGWELAEVVVDGGFSGKSLRRPGLMSVLERLHRREADGLIVAKLDRLSRSMLDFTAIMATAQKEGWAVVALDCAVDTTTPAGEAMANVLATFAQFERRIISQRTKDALAIKKAQGVRLGRPLMLAPAVRERIITERSSGRSFAKIAARLNAEAVPTAHGGSQWWPSTVRAALQAA